MNLSFKLARSVRRDLQEISDFWTFEAGGEVSRRVVGGIMETIITISDHPRAGVEADQFRVGVRKFPTGKYMI